MTFSVSHWSGRTGNNIQQVANCIMAAEKNKGTFQQKLDFILQPHQKYLVILLKKNRMKIQSLTQDLHMEYLR